MFSRKFQPFSEPGRNYFGRLCKQEISNSRRPRTINVGQGPLSLFRQASTESLREVFPKFGDWLDEMFCHIPFLAVQRNISACQSHNLVNIFEGLCSHSGGCSFPEDQQEKWKREEAIQSKSRLLFSTAPFVVDLANFCVGKAFARDI